MRDADAGCGMQMRMRDGFCRLCRTMTGETYPASTEFSDPAALLGDQNSLLAGADVEFAEDHGDVVADSSGGQQERSRDLTCRLTASTGTEHVELAIGQRAALIAQRVRGDLRIDVACACRDAADDGCDLVSAT